MTTLVEVLSLILNGVVVPTKADASRIRIRWFANLTALTHDHLLICFIVEKRVQGLIDWTSRGCHSSSLMLRSNLIRLVR